MNRARKHIDRLASCHVIVRNFSSRTTEIIETTISLIDDQTDHDHWESRHNKYPSENLVLQVKVAIPVNIDFRYKIRDDDVNLTHQDDNNHLDDRIRLNTYVFIIKEHHII